MLDFAALADPTRQHIVKLLAKGERSAGDIASRFELTPPAVSQHLKVLREAGLVHVRPLKQQRLYSLNRQSLADMAEAMPLPPDFGARGVICLNGRPVPAGYRGVDTIERHGQTILRVDEPRLYQVVCTTKHLSPAELRLIDTSGRFAAYAAHFYGCAQD